MIDMKGATTDVKQLQDALVSMVCQFAGWSEANGGCYWTMGLSALEEAFACLGFCDLMPAPEARCDEPGCTKQATCGWPMREGGHRQTCSEHTPGKEYFESAWYRDHLQRQVEKLIAEGGEESP